MWLSTSIDVFCTRVAFSYPAMVCWCQLLRRSCMRFNVWLFFHSVYIIWLEHIGEQNVKGYRISVFLFLSGPSRMSAYPYRKKRKLTIDMWVYASIQTLSPRARKRLWFQKSVTLRTISQFFIPLDRKTRLRNRFLENIIRLKKLAVNFDVFSTQSTSWSIFVEKYGILC